MRSEYFPLLLTWNRAPVASVRCLPSLQICRLGRYQESPCSPGGGSSWRLPLLSLSSVVLPSPCSIHLSPLRGKKCIQVDIFAPSLCMTVSQKAKQKQYLYLCPSPLFWPYPRRCRIPRYWAGCGPPAPAGRSGCPDTACPRWTGRPSPPPGDEKDSALRGSLCLGTEWGHTVVCEKPVSAAAVCLFENKGKNRVSKLGASLSIKFYKVFQDGYLDSKIDF